MSMAPSSMESPISSLPVELFRSILQLVFAVSDHALTSPRTRFGQRIQSSAQYLLVSRWWLVVGAPLLYHTIVLRSAAQVHILRMTLLEHPGLGLLARNLRVEEGAYCTEIRQITVRTPHVETLVLSLVVYRATNTLTLCGALACLSPRRIVLHDPGSTITRNKSMDRVVEALSSIMRGSHYLDTFEWHVQWRSKTFVLPRTLCFADALVQTPRLRIVAVSSSRNAGILAFIRKILDKSTVEQIYVVDCPVRMKRKIKSDLSSSESAALRRIKLCNRFSEVPGNEVAIRRRVSTKNNVNSCHLPEYIIKRIVEYALLSIEILDETLFSDGVDETMFHASKRTFRSLTRVSKLFYSLVRPFKFLHISINDFNHGMQLLRDFLRESHCSRLPLVHSVYVDRYQPIATNMEYQAKQIVLNALCSMPWLTELALPAGRADILSLAIHLGRTLTKLDVCLESCPNDQYVVTDESIALCPADFSGFYSLEVLWLRCGGTFPMIADSLSEGSGNAEMVRLEKLRVLTIQDYEDSRVFRLVTQWALPNLKRLSIAGSFKRPSESELSQVYDIIDSMFGSARVETLALGHGNVDPDVEILSRALDSTTLKKVELCFSYKINGAHARSAVMPFFERICDDLDTNPRNSRVIKEFQIRSLFRWPYTDSEIRRSVWPNCLDALVRNFGISVTNHRGVAWRPRLKI